MRKEVIRDALQMNPPAHVVDIMDELKSVLHLAPHLAKFVKEKPYDLGLNWEGRYIALELKLVKDAFSFRPQDLLEMPHQWNGLVSAHNSQAPSGMLVRFRFALTPKQKKLFPEVEGWLLDLTFFLSTAILADKGLEYSFSLRELLTEGLLIPQVGGIYNLEPLWKNPYASDMSQRKILPLIPKATT